MTPEVYMNPMDRGWLKQIDDDKENILKPGEWNKMRIRVVGDKVQTWLNGQPMVDFSDEKIGKGRWFNSPCRFMTEEESGLNGVIW